jgi:hypothetical protein
MGTVTNVVKVSFLDLSTRFSPVEIDYIREIAEFDGQTFDHEADMLMRDPISELYCALKQVRVYKRAVNDKGYSEEMRKKIKSTVFLVYMGCHLNDANFVEKEAKEITREKLDEILKLRSSKDWLNWKD